MEQFYKNWFTPEKNTRRLVNENIRLTELELQILSISGLTLEQIRDKFLEGCTLD